MVVKAFKKIAKTVADSALDKIDETIVTMVKSQLNEPEDRWLVSIKIHELDEDDQKHLVNTLRRWVDKHPDDEEIKKLLLLI